MCDTCGCGENDGLKIHGPLSNHKHSDSEAHDHDHIHEHEHEHEHEHPHSHTHPHTHSPEGNSDDEHDHEHEHYQKKTLNLNLDILSRNNLTAEMNRRFFEGRKVLCLNLVSSPGSGKTTILEKTIKYLKATRKLYVIEGDQQTLLDADRIDKAGAPAVQINTGSGCHLDANMIDKATRKLDPDTNSVLFIENVGNLVCPAMFDLGEFKRVVVISVTEGDDKPLKYPYMFQSSQLCIINKSDLLPYVDFSIEETIKHARLINHELEFIEVSAKTDEGMESWFQWITQQEESFATKKGYEKS